MSVHRRDWPIIVGGCHRSGTSLVRRILDSHSRIHCGPEVLFFRDFYGEYRDDRYAHLRFMRTARDLVTEDEALLVLGGAHIQLHRVAARNAGKPRWADKAPENVLYTQQWNELLESTWILVHVVRNPLDTVASMSDRFPLTLPQDLEGRIRHYRAYTEAGSAFARAHPDRCVRVVYEELCQAPAQAVTRLMAALGEAAEPLQLRVNAVEHQSGLEDPEVSRSSSIREDSVGRWTRDMARHEAELVWSRTGELWTAIDPEHHSIGAPKPPGGVGNQQ